MRRTSSRTVGRILAVALLMMLVFTLSPLQIALADVNENFDTGFTNGQTADSVTTVPGITSFVSSPVNSTVLNDQLATFAGGAFTGLSVSNAQAGPAGTLTMNFSPPQFSYSMDIALLSVSGAGTFIFRVQGFRTGVTDPVFTEDVSLNYTGTPLVSTDVSAHAGNTFDRLVVSSTADNWGFDNLVTTDSVPNVSFYESSGSTNVAEGGASDTYQIALDTTPTGNVVIDLSTPDSQCTVTPNQVTLNSLTPATVTVNAVNDAVQETSPHDCVIGHTINVGLTADVDYAALNNLPDLTAHVTDNDTPGATIVESAGSTDIIEGGATDSYTIRLNSQPSNNVTVAIAPDAQCTVDHGGSVLFTPANALTPVTITVTAVNDNIAETGDTCTIAHTATSSDLNYNGITIDPVVANITDNDTAGVTITESAGSTNITEGGATDTYTVRLTSQPTDEVTVTILPDSECTVDSDPGAGTSAEVVFAVGTSSWQTPQTVTVTAVNDTADEGNHDCIITHTVASGDPNYNPAPFNSDTVTAHITDNDAPGGVTVTESGLSTSVVENGPNDTYTLVLTTQPTATVTITITPNAQCTVDHGGSVAFTTVNWATPVTILVTAVNDSIDELPNPNTCTITHTATSTDLTYNGIAINSVIANVSDDDVAGVTLVQSGGTTSLTEGGTDTYTLVLDSQPTSNVTVTATPSNSNCDLGDGPGVAHVVTFTTGTTSWHTAQTVTVSSRANDAIDQDTVTCVVNHTVASSDTFYNGITVPNDGFTVTVLDNDTAGITITPTGTTVITEAGVTDTYSIVLTSQPTADVDVTATPDVQCTVDTNAVGTSNVATFTSANWNVAQIITITAVNDLIDEAATHSCVITHTSSSTDLKYNALTLTSITANVTDNDTAGITITPTGTTLIAEGGITDTYSIVLTSQPTANVSVTASVPAPAQCTVDTDAVGTSNIATFTSANWNVAQILTITAVDDALAEGPHTCVIAHTVASTDANYNVPPLAALASVTATIIDNDGPPSPANAAPPRNYFIIGTPTFAWSEVSWAVRYEVQVATNMTFTTGLKTYLAITTQYFTIPGPDTLADGVYYWRVRACSTTTCAPYSPAEQFTVNIP